mgnify:CR=1 FL=1
MSPHNFYQHIWGQTLEEEEAVRHKCQGESFTPQDPNKNCGTTLRGTLGYSTGLTQITGSKHLTDIATARKYPQLHP